MKKLSPVGVVFGDLRNEETLQQKTKNFVCQLRLMSTNIALVVVVSPAIVAFGVDLLALIAMPAVCKLKLGSSRVPSPIVRL